jgi:hypothetical protein
MPSHSITSSPSKAFENLKTLITQYRRVVRPSPPAVFFIL